MNAILGGQQKFYQKGLYNDHKWKLEATTFPFSINWLGYMYRQLIGSVERQF